MRALAALQACVVLLLLAEPPHAQTAVYGAEDLAQANTIFLDSSFGMGYNAREMHQVCAVT
jgi:hypothetical protein